MAASGSRRIVNPQLERVFFAFKDPKTSVTVHVDKRDVAIEGPLTIMPKGRFSSRQYYAYLKDTSFFWGTDPHKDPTHHIVLDNLSVNVHKLGREGVELNYEDYDDQGPIPRSLVINHTG